MSPHLPITPAQIAAEAVAAARAGAAIVHLHARDRVDGRPTGDPVFREFLPRIRAACDAVINITTGGGQNMTVDDAWRVRSPVVPRCARSTWAR